MEKVSNLPSPTLSALCGTGPLEISPERLKNFLGRYGLTQMQFAEMLGVSRVTVSTWCNGRASVRGPVVTLIAYYLAYGPLPVGFGEEVFGCLDETPEGFTFVGRV